MSASAIMTLFVSLGQISIFYVHSSLLMYYTMSSSILNFCFLFPRALCSFIVTFVALHFTFQHLISTYDFRYGSMLFK